MENIETTPCKGCGKPMVWGQTELGQKIPLDPSPMVYAFRVDASRDTGLPQVIVYRNENAMVSHFATCSNTNELSKSKKK